MGVKSRTPATPSLAIGGVPMDRLPHLSVPARIGDAHQLDGGAKTTENAAANDETYHPNGEAKSTGYARWICGQSPSAGANDDDFIRTTDKGQWRYNPELT
jgi:hypothetical protein